MRGTWLPTELPESDDPAYDDVIQAAAGLAGLSARVTGEPSLLPTVIVDKVCGLMIVYAIMAALFHRAVAGEGQRVEVPMFETALGFTLVEHLAAATSLPPLGPPGYDRVLTPHRRPYRTADGWVTILPYLPKNWLDLWAALDRDDLVHALQALSACEVMAGAPLMYEELGQLTPAAARPSGLSSAVSIRLPRQRCARLTSSSTIRPATAAHWSRRSIRPPVPTGRSSRRSGSRPRRPACTVPRPWSENIPPSCWPRSVIPLRKSAIW